MPQRTLVKKFVSKLKEEGVLSAIKTVFRWVRVVITNPIYCRRVQLSKQLDQLLNSTVKYGPFKGLKLAADSWWGSSDRAAILLGLYEQEILCSLKQIPSNYKTFIDLGAADGYYGIGVLINEMFEKSYCFELSTKGQNVIRQNSVLNGVADKVEVRGIAKKDFYKELSSDELLHSVLFIDIEGGEFDLLDVSVFGVFRSSIVFIELHDWFFSDGDERLQKLKNSAKLTHNISELTMTSRDLSRFEELSTYNDTDRWLICSEGRERLMTWLRLDPRQ